MFARDPAHSSFNQSESALTRDSVTRLQPRWTLNVGAPLAAAPTVSAGILYFGAWDGQFYAVDAQSGRVLWQTFLGMAPAPADPKCFPAIGVTSQAAVLGDTLYAGGGDAALYALDRATGRQLARVPLADPQAGAYLWSSVTASGAALYIGVASLGDCPLVRGAVARLDPAALDQPPQVRYLAPQD
jgi:outer membrane protein assembly factor BamB